MQRTPSHLTAGIPPSCVSGYLSAAMVALPHDPRARPCLLHLVERILYPCRAGQCRINGKGGENWTVAMAVEGRIATPSLLRTAMPSFLGL